MYRIGIIGTSKIVEDSVKAFLDTNKAVLQCVYSRQMATGEEFAQKFECSVVETDLDKFAQRDDIDVVYIASPNTFHFEQAKKMLLAKKHVVVEKPAVVTKQQWDTLQQLAQQNNVYIFEAIRHVYEPNFKEVTQLLNSKQIDGAVLNFGQYSSRMNDLLQGRIQNIFKPEMSAGVLMDLGVYVLHSALHWFGAPLESVYYPVKYTNGIDIQGDIVLRYDTFNVVGHISKRTQSLAKSEIYNQADTIAIDSVDHIKSVVVHTPKQQQVVIESYPEKRMQSQWEVFFDVLESKEEAINYYEKVNNITGKVISIMEQLRKDNAIQFPADY